MMIYYKILGLGRKPCHGGTGTIPANRWTRRIKDTRHCRRGYHITDAEGLAAWLYADQLPLQIWECEAEGVSNRRDDKYVCERIKLTRLVGTLDAVDLRWIAADIAQTALHLTHDPRPAETIQAVRAYCLGVLDNKGLQEASEASEAAAWASRAASEASAAWASQAASEASEAWASWASRTPRGAAWASRASRAARWGVYGRIVLDYLEATT